MHGINLAPLVDVLASLLLAILSGAVPIVLPRVLKVLGVTLDAQHRAALTQTIQNSIGQALSVAQKAGDASLSNVTIKNVAVGQMVAYILNHAPDAIAHFGLSDADIARMADGALAKHLHETVGGEDLPIAPPDPTKTAEKLDKLETSNEPIPLGGQHIVVGSDGSLSQCNLQAQSNPSQTLTSNAFNRGIPT